jgi:hypothetical protein
MDDEIKQRQTELLKQLTGAAKRSHTLGQLNYTAVLWMAWISVGASIAAGLLGLLGMLQAKWVGVIAFLPAALTIAANTLKLQGKANWHYQQEIELNSLSRRLQFEMPVNPSADNIAAISEGWRKVSESMEGVWRDTLTVDLSHLPKDKSQP